MDDEEPECNGPDCGHAEDCPYYLEMMKEDSSWRDELERYNKIHDKGTTNGKKSKVFG